MFFLSNPNGIEGTFGAPPALSLARRENILNGDGKKPMTTVSGSSLKTLREEASRCRACHLWKNATQTVFGKITPINKNRGRPIDLDDGIKALVTVHPSYLLRLPDADAKAREYVRFVDDLKIAAALLRKSAHAA
jgi:uracil-DNA glycosylase